MKNIVLVMMDQLRKDVVCHEKSPQTSTPHLDRLRAESVSCDNAFVQFPTCIPSRASITTGLYPHQMGIFNHACTISDSIVTLPERLVAQGYDAVAFGKTHGQHKGYHHYPERDGVEGYGTNDLGFGSRKDAILGTFSGRLANQHDMAACRQFSDYLCNRSWGKPFIAHVGIMAPHPPLYPPQEFAGTCSPEGINLTLLNDAERASQPRMWRYIAEKRWLIHSEEYRRRIVAGYLDMVSYADHCLGLILQSLQECHLLDDTLVVVTADHGEMLGEHEMIGKWFSLYDDVLRVPLIIRLPSRSHAGTRLLQMIEMVDLVPTLLDLAGAAAVPGDLPGRSLSPLFAHPDAPHRDRIFAMTENAYLVRTGRHKLIVAARRPCRNFPTELFSDRENQLFDLEADPGEHRNIHADPSHAGVRADLAESLIQHLIRHHQ